MASVGKKRFDKYSGTDYVVYAQMNEAAMAALEEKLGLAKSSSDSFADTIKEKHFVLALIKMTPSVSGKVGFDYDCNTLCKN